ncbi:MAG: tetratricopeptide repeat protein [Burkholderiales bacterium]
MPPANDAGQASLYVPRILQQHLVDAPDERAWLQEGTAAFCDVSGFTKLSERLAKKGREGAEQIADAIGHVFEALLEVAYQQGGSLLKFGGDALLLWFEGPGHALRATRATVVMRRVLRKVGRIEVPGARVMLKMSQAVHTGDFHFFAVGASHHELLTTGPAWSRLVEMEHDATGGDIVVSPETASHLPAGCIGEPKGHGLLIAREPPGKTTLPLVARPAMAPEAIARCLPPAVRAHVTAGGGNAELRPVSIAFLRFEGVDELIAEQGLPAAADALHALVCAVESATEAQDVAFLASDVDQDGGKIIMTAGAPKVTGDDEERMMLALRAIITTPLAIPIRIGVNRGSVFAGDIGPFYRRTYTVMGDAINLAARVMAKSAPGHLYATADVLNRSNTLFATTAIEPFMVKGKAKPVQAWDVGAATGSRGRLAAAHSLPLVGRDGEMGTLRDALARARAGNGTLVDIVGEAGAGKTRLLAAVKEGAEGFSVLHAVCEAYTASTPYAVWREMLREGLGFGRDASDEVVGHHLASLVHERIPGLAPWLPLVAIPFGVTLPPTPEVSALAEKNLRTRLHETVAAFMDAVLPAPMLVEIENVHHMDLASGELLAHIASGIAKRPWVVVVARRPGAHPSLVAPTIAHLELAPLAAPDALRMAQLACAANPLPRHVLGLVASRSGGNPQFLLDLMSAAMESGGVEGLPDSAEAATMARIDALAPEDRFLVRRASIFGLTFHPRMLAWLDADGQGSPADSSAWSRLSELFEEEADGYLRFRRTLVRDAAYEGLPFKLRRELHGAAARHMEHELESPEDAADLLSLHYFVAGDHRAAWRYASHAARNALAAYAFVEAARMFSRAIDAARKLKDVPARELAHANESLADCWYRAGEMPKAADGYRAAIRLAGDDRLFASSVLLKRSKLEEKLGKYPQALRWAAQASRAVEGLSGEEAARQVARLSAWYATVLQDEGRTQDAMRWATRAIDEAKAVDDPEALGAAYWAMSWALGVLGRDGAKDYLQLSLDAYRRSGNILRQAQLLTNLGVIQQWEGDWDGALASYEGGRTQSQKLGNSFDATVAQMNVAEILSDRGQLDEAQDELLETLPVWRASRYRYLLGGCLWLLGRVSLRAGRFGEALERLNEARALFVAVKREEEVLDVDARIAECRTFLDEPEAALQFAQAGLAKLAPDAKLVSLLQRVRGHALMRTGDLAGARQALEASLALARTRKDLQETVLSLHSLLALLRVAGEPAPGALAAEYDALVQRLAIRSLPALPVPRQAAPVPA